MKLYMLLLLVAYHILCKYFQKMVKLKKEPKKNILIISLNFKIQELKKNYLNFN